MVAGFAEVVEREEILVAVGRFEPSTFGCRLRFCVRRGRENGRL